MADEIRSAQYRHEIASGAASGAASSAIMSSLVSGASNMYAVLKDEKSLKEALKDVGKSTIKAVYDAMPEPANIMSLDNYSRQADVV